MMNKNLKILFALMVGIIAAAIIFLASGCEIIKKTRKSSADSTSVSKRILDIKDSTNSGSTHKEDSKKIEESEWWRIIQTFKPDTTVNNFHTYPATVIYEGGKGKSEETKSISDSAWYMNIMQSNALMFDSLNRKIDILEKNKKSETKGLGIFSLALILLGYFLLTEGFKFLKTNYTFTKKIKE